MSRIAPVVLAALSLLLALAVAGAAGSSPAGFPYPRLAVVSFVAYAGAGLVGARRAGLGGGVVAALLVGFLDAILAPAAAWLVGSGALAGGFPEPRVYAYRIALVTATALGLGLAGAWAGVVLGRRARGEGNRASA